MSRELLLEAFDSHVKDEPVLRELVEKFPIPEVFWEASASTTGKYHPSFSVGEGGLMRHTLLAMYWCTRWAQFLSATKFDTDIAVTAAALHDSYKGGYIGPWTCTLPEHAFIASAEVRRYTRENPDMGPKHAARYPLVADAIYTHMGVFSADPRNPKTTGFTPITLDGMSVPGQILALADYSSSQKIYDAMAQVIGEMK